ncbi:MAG TPA: 2-phospho-L-lactate transferase [Candidatus Dormibacteraeota bacterium]|nr:2-phospho-L-lactate transferase [Candidatus Dormibacteraeota bacterium]
MSVGPILALNGMREALELAGGVGGARLAAGLQDVVGDRLTVVVNGGDDLTLQGLSIWPDHDTVLYTLAGLEDPARGWGLQDETWSAIDQLARYGETTWFRVGDRDLATHVARTARLHAGERPTEVAAELSAALGVRARILPMSDAPVRTLVRTDEGWLEFQEYFVARRQEPTVHEVRFDGAELAAPTPEVLAALDAASAVVVAPSNPIVSVGPILALNGMREALELARERGVPIVAVSPIVAGRALKGPADRMLTSLGHESSALGVARLYRGLVDGIVIDRQDEDLARAIQAVGPAVRVADTIMVGAEGRERLAREVLDFAVELSALRDRSRERRPRRGAAAAVAAS